MQTSKIMELMVTTTIIERKGLKQMLLLSYKRSL